MGKVPFVSRATAQRMMLSQSEADHAFVLQIQSFTETGGRADALWRSERCLIHFYI